MGIGVLRLSGHKYLQVRAANSISKTEHSTTVKSPTSASLVLCKRTLLDEKKSRTGIMFPYGDCKLQLVRRQAGFIGTRVEVPFCQDRTDTSSP